MKADTNANANNEGHFSRPRGNLELIDGDRSLSTQISSLDGIALRNPICDLDANFARNQTGESHVPY